MWNLLMPKQATEYSYLHVAYLWDNTCDSAGSYIMCSAYCECVSTMPLAYAGASSTSPHLPLPRSRFGFATITYLLSMHGLTLGLWGWDGLAFSRFLQSGCHVGTYVSCCGDALQHKFDMSAFQVHTYGWGLYIYVYLRRTYIYVYIQLGCVVLP